MTIGVDSHLLASDACFRCGYMLHGIADDQACPECGLLAERSRRPTDALHDARPRWLRKLSLGVWLILVAIALALPYWVLMLSQREYEIFFWIYRIAGRGFRAIQTTWFYQAPEICLFPSMLLFLSGIWLVVSREGYGPADKADAQRRRWLRLLAIIPLLSLSAFVWTDFVHYSTTTRFARVAIAAGCALCCTPIPLLLFFQLRSLAMRARSAQLAEHCAIVGAGGSLSLPFSILLFLAFNGEFDWELTYRLLRSDLLSLLVLLIAVSCSLHYGWALMLMIRFALAFRRAAQVSRGSWRRDDRSMLNAIS